MTERAIADLFDAEEKFDRRGTGSIGLDDETMISDPTDFLNRRHSQIFVGEEKNVEEMIAKGERLLPVWKR